MQQHGQQLLIVMSVPGVQVVVFALGIGTTVQQAEKLVGAFQQLCKHPHQSALSKGAGSLSAADADLTDSSQQAAIESTQQAAVGVNSLQEMSLREAFFARTARSASVYSSIIPLVPNYAFIFQILLWYSCSLSWPWKIKTQHVDHGEDV